MHSLPLTRGDVQTGRGAHGQAGKKVVWYSVDSKFADSRPLVDHQMIAGTPTVQTFLGMKQVGDEIRTMDFAELMKIINSRAPA